MDVEVEVTALVDFGSCDERLPLEVDLVNLYERKRLYTLKISRLLVEAQLRSDVDLL